MFDQLVQCPKKTDMLELITKSDNMVKEVGKLKDEMGESRRLLEQLESFFDQPVDEKMEKEMKYKMDTYDQLEKGMNKLLFRAETLNQTID